MSKPRKMSARERQEQVSAFVILCFNMLDEQYSWKEIANLAGLSISTVYRLLGSGPTGRTHINTLQGLASAAGLRFELTPYKASVRLAG